MATNFKAASQRIPLLSAGAHMPDHQGCALEYLSVARGLEWTDDPASVRCWDLRPLNDIPVSDRLRTELLMPVLRAYDGSMDWPLDRQQAVAERLVVLTVQRIVAELPSLSSEMRRQCTEAATLKLAEAAAVAAAAAVATAEDEARAAAEAEAAAVAAGGAAEEAAGDAAAAAWAAGNAAGAARLEQVFRVACQVWLDAAMSYSKS